MSVAYSTILPHDICISEKMRHYSAWSPQEDTEKLTIRIKGCEVRSEGARKKNRRGALQEQIKVLTQDRPAHQLLCRSKVLNHSLPIRQTGPSEQQSQWYRCLVTHSICSYRRSHQLSHTNRARLSCYVLVTAICLCFADRERQTERERQRWAMAVR